MISRNVAGQTKKAVVIAANFVAWATAASIGKQQRARALARISILTQARAPGLFVVGCASLLHRFLDSSRMLQLARLRHHRSSLAFAPPEQEEG